MLLPVRVWPVLTHNRAPHSHSRCSDEGNSFFIIRDGEVKCTKGGAKVSARLGKGDFFGELALLSSDKRAATVTATKATTVLSLKRDEFTRLLGPLKDLISETAAASRS